MEGIRSFPKCWQSFRFGKEAFSLEWLVAVADSGCADLLSDVVLARRIFVVISGRSLDSDCELILGWGCIGKLKFTTRKSGPREKILNFCL